MTGRVPLLVSIAFVAVLLAGLGAVPNPPDVLAHGHEVVAWAAEHKDAIRWQAWLVMVSTVPGSVLVALTWRRMTGPEAIPFLMGGIATVGILTIAVLLRLALARHAGSGLGAEDARLLADIEAYWAPLLTFPISIQAAAIVVAARRGDLARWLGAIALVLAGVQLLESATIFGTAGLFAPGGALNSYLGPAVYSVWIVGLGFALSQPAPAPSRSMLRSRNP